MEKHLLSITTTLIGILQEQSPETITNVVADDGGSLKEVSFENLIGTKILPIELS